MDYLKFAKYFGIFTLIVSGIVYVIGDPITKLLSYQGPIIGSGVLGWYVLNSANKDKIIEDEKGERFPLVAFAYRKYAPLSFIIGLALTVPWLTPFMFKIEETNQILFAASFVSMAISGFIMGYFISSLTFIEKVLVYSLGFLGDILYFFIIYDAANLFGTPITIVVNYILLLVFGLKFPEGVLFALYIVKKVKAI